MPVKRCTKDGRSGYKWGDKGTCYTGPDAREKAERQGRAIKAREGQNMDRKEVQVKSNIACNVQARTEFFEGEEYIVFPVVALVEGVHNDLFYPEEEIAKFAQAWNGRPVPVLHPYGETGEPISVNEPKILQEQNVGQTFNFRFEDHKLVGEIWVNKRLAEEKFPGLISQMHNNMEISTSMFLEADGQPGEWNGESYITAVYNYRPDHVALLPGSVGACSWQDGCGIRVNQGEMLAALSDGGPVAFTSSFKTSNDGSITFRTLAKKDILPPPQNNISKKNISFEEIMSGLRQFVDSLDRHDGDLFVLHMLEAVYDNRFIYSRSPTKEDNAYRFYEVNYSLKEDGSVDVNDNEKKEVRPKKTWEDVPQQNEDNNKTGGTKMAENEKKNPCCPDRVAALISNEKTPFTADDAEFLNSLSSERLEEFEKPFAEKEKTGTEDLTVNNKLTEEARKSVNEQEKKEPVTVEGYVANAPREIAEMLTAGLSTYQKMRGDMITKIMASNQNKFTKDRLEAMDLETLRNVHSLLPEDKPSGNLSTPFYGVGGPASLESGEEVLEPPKMDFGGK